MNGIFQIKKFNQKTILGFMDDLRKKDLDVSLIWYKNAKEVSRYEGRMPENANAARIKIDHRSCMVISKTTSTIDSRQLSEKEINTIIETLIENEWVKKPDIASGIFCSILHIAILVILIVMEWEQTRLLSFSYGACIIFISIGYIGWVPKIKQGQKMGKLMFVPWCIGILLTSPLSLLQIPLFKALQRETFYVSAANLFPEHLNH